MLLHHFWLPLQQWVQVFLLAPLQDHHIVKQCACYPHGHAPNADVRKHHYHAGASNASSAGRLDCHAFHATLIVLRMLDFSRDDTVAGRANEWWHNKALGS